jgi:hypothetical protein
LKIEFSVLDTGNNLCYNIKYEPSEGKRNFLPIEGNSKSIIHHQTGRHVMLSRSTARIHNTASLLRAQKATDNYTFMPISPISAPVQKKWDNGVEVGG